MRVLVLLAACAALALSAAAAAHPPGPALSVAIEALRKVPVSYNTESGYSELEAEAIVRRLAESKDVGVALVAPSAIMLAGPDATARDVAAHLGDDRAFIVASGSQIGAWAGKGSEDDVRALERRARDAHRGQPPALAVAELAGLLAERQRLEAADDPPAWLWPSVAIGSLLVLLFGAVLLRSRRPAARAATPRP